MSNLDSLISKSLFCFFCNFATIAGLFLEKLLREMTIHSSFPVKDEVKKVKIIDYTRIVLLSHTSKNN